MVRALRGIQSRSMGDPSGGGDRKGDQLADPIAEGCSLTRGEVVMDRRGPDPGGGQTNLLSADRFRAKVRQAGT